MRRSIFVLVFSVLGLASAAAREHAFSPDKHFEAYIVAAEADGTGSKLFLRASGRDDPGVLLCTNTRWIAARWSPDSRFLTVIDHFDGHMADVYIYYVTPGATPSGVVHDLRYRSPDSGVYDTQWDVVRWNTKRATATVLRVTRRDEQRFVVPLDSGSKHP